MPDNVQPPRREPEGIVLKGKPRPVARFNRKLFTGVAIVAALILSGVVGKAFQDKAQPKAAADDRIKVGGTFSSEALAALPKSYAQVKQPDSDVHEAPPPPPAEPNAAAGRESEDARNERLRLQQKRRDAKEAGVFFQTSQNRGQAGAVAGGSWGANNASASSTSDFSFNFERDQNNQQGKQDFLSRTASSTTNPYALMDAVSPYQVMAGSIISASLLTGINSDLPGFVTAQVTENVYDTATGRFLLIPQGSRLIGRYDSVVTFGQKRALLVWQRLVMPDASSISLENLPATDTSGYAGLEDKVDAHTWQLVKGVALSTLLGVGTEIGFGDDEGDFIRALRESTQQSVNRAGQRITERNLDIQPTLKIRQGWPVRVIIHKDLILRPYRGRR
ncbi:MAG: TrbI/VirB10 family protein [Rhodospirillaceae bacterium]